MKIILLPGLLILLSIPHVSFAQEYSYTHYDISDGLAGSTVYCITQDKDGFIWAGTETGVSRFDGTHFRNFTTMDGLPDVEILQMFADSRDRVWMAPFRKSICYYFNGRIYNQDNDSLLAALHIKGNIEHFAEDAAGDILIQESSAMHLIKSDGTVAEIDSIHGRPIDYCHGISKSRDGYFLVQEADSIYEFRAGVFKTLFGLSLPETNQVPGYFCLSPELIVWRADIGHGCIRSMKTGQVRYIPFQYQHYRHVSYSILGDSLVYSNESVGATEYNFYSPGEKDFLPGVEVSDVFRDDGGNIWYSTIGRGLYRLNSDEFRNIRLSRERCDNCAAFSILKVKDELLVGTSRNSVFRYRLPEMQLLNVTNLNSEERKRILGIEKLRDGRTVYGTDFSLAVHSPDGKEYQYMKMSVKGMSMRPDGKMIVASGIGAFVIDLDRGKIVDTIWKERTTTIYYHADTIYVGTLNGLYRIWGRRQSYYMGQDIPSLRTRISSVVESPSGVLWIAPYDDAGVVGVKDGRVIRRIGSAQGLTSDICRNLALQGDTLWVGTDKGLNRIDLRNPDQPVTRYTANDGLGSNVINTIFVDSPRIYVGTSAGFSFFDETKESPRSNCRFVWLDIYNGGRSRISDSAELRMSYKENGVRFEYAGISYKSSGNISYRYRMLGLDTAWKTTQQTFLDYPVLPSGKYGLEIMAIDKFGSHSRMASVHITVSTPFWGAGWFVVAVTAVLASLVWFLVSMRIKMIRRRQQEEKMLIRRLGEMEHMALQAQMNPHFIFNCMNSIQQYIFNQDVFAANKYISGFSKLIRATLQNSSKPMITLAEEITYLSTYLSLEKLRFKDQMEYHIDVEPAINPAKFMIPPMMIQPYAENCMRHGLRHKTTGKGYICIQVRLSNGGMAVMIEDNGIGREKAGVYKTVEHIEYQSRGMSLTAERIKIMNSIYGRDIAVEVVDLKDEDGSPAGTRVIITFPLHLTTMKNNPYDPDGIN